MSFESMGKVVEDERALGWDDTIEKESAGFIILPEGDYTCKVAEFQRARHEGSEKLPPCNKAVITLEVETHEGVARIRHQLFLHSRTEGMISAFFIGIGLKKHGEPLQMNWNKVIGRTCRAKIGIRTHNDRQYNEIKKFYEPENNNIAPTQNNKPAAYQPGVF